MSIIIDIFTNQWPIGISYQIDTIDGQAATYYLAVFKRPECLLNKSKK